MSYKNQQPAVSKPLLIGLIVVAIIGAIMFARNMFGGSATEENVEGSMDIPESVRNMGPASPQPGEPSAQGLGGR